MTQGRHDVAGDKVDDGWPKNIVDGQFSMYFTGALALDQGSFGWDDYKRLGDGAIEKLSDRIDVVQDARLEGKSHPFGARITVESNDGVHERIVPDPSGEPSSFPDTQMMRQKFLTLARPVLADQAEKFGDAVLKMEAFGTVKRNPTINARDLRELRSLTEISHESAVQGSYCERVVDKRADVRGTQLQGRMP